MDIFAKTGNGAFLERSKIAFLSSRKAPPELNAVSREWVNSLNAETDCVMCGNLTVTENFVLSILLEAKIPTVLVLAEAMYERFWGDVAAALDAGRLLVITHCDSSVHSVSARSAQDRNYLMLSLADKIVVGNVTEGGNLEHMLVGYDNVTYLKNEHLLGKWEKREQEKPVFGNCCGGLSVESPAWSKCVKLDTGILNMSFCNVGGEQLVRIEQKPCGVVAGEIPRKIFVSRTEAAPFCAVVSDIMNGGQQLSANGDMAIIKSASGDVTVNSFTKGDHKEYVFTQNKDLGYMGMRCQKITVSLDDFMAFASLVSEMATIWKL